MGTRLRVGFYRAEITPPAGTPFAGYSLRGEASRGVHDPLFTAAMYLEWEGGSVAILSADVLGITEELHRKIAELVGEKLGIGEDSVVVAATHNHAGPDLYGTYSDYNERLVERFVETSALAAVNAAFSAKPVSAVRAATGECRGITVNRRRPLGGPVDPRVHVLALETGSREYAILNFTCHGVVLGHNNLFISADYPGAFVKCYEEVRARSKALFLNGACGDINPFTPGTRLDRVYDRTVGTFQDVECFGAILARTVAQALASSPREQAEDVSFKARRLSVELQGMPPLDELEENLRKAEEAVRLGKPGSRYELFIARRALMMAKKLSGVRQKRIYIAALKVNNYAIAFLPSEVFVDLQLYIKRSSPFEFTAVATYVNGYFGYIPTASAFDEGGYEASFPMSIIKRGEGERIAEEALALLRSL